MLLAYGPKITLASHSFPATAWLSCYIFLCILLKTRVFWLPCREKHFIVGFGVTAYFWCVTDRKGDGQTDDEMWQDDCKQVSSVLIYVVYSSRYQSQQMWLIKHTMYPEPREDKCLVNAEAFVAVPCGSQVCLVMCLTCMVHRCLTCELRRPKLKV